MKSAADKYTIDAFDKARRGRSPKPHAKTNAQRQQDFHQRRKFNFLNSVVRNKKGIES